MPLVRIRDVGKDATDTFYSGGFEDRYIVEAGDLLVGMDGDFNCARWRGPKSLLNQRVCKISIDSDKYLPRFLDYVLPGYLRAINRATSSITVKHLSSRTVEQIPVPLPPMEEQVQIVAEIEKQFSRLDEAVASLQRVRANLKRYETSVLKAAFDGRLVESEASIAAREVRDFESGAQLVRRVVEERRLNWSGRRSLRVPDSPHQADLPELPEGWTWSTFDAVADRVTVGHVGSMKSEYVSSGIPFLRSQNVRANRFEPEGLKYITPAFHALLEKSSLSPGDIVVVRSGSVGVSCVIPEGLPTANCSDLVIIKSPRAVHAKFGAYYLNSVVESRIASGRVGVALVHFNTQSVAELPVPLPPLAEQLRIVAEIDRRLSVVREVEAEVDANLKRAQALRQAILAKAFAG